MKIMGIINLSEDSFCETGKFSNNNDAVKYAEYLISIGCDIIDLGAESTQQGFDEKNSEEQLDKLIPFINQFNKIKKQTMLSIDTRSVRVMEECGKLGVSFFNTITTGEEMSNLADFIKHSNSEIILTHMPVEHKESKNLITSDIINYLISFFSKTREELISKGVSGEKIIIDPGIGFGKSGSDNLKILSNLDIFVQQFERVCIGVSNKKFSSKVFEGIKEKDYPLVTLINTALSGYQGVEIARVHDVGVNKDASEVVKATLNS